MEKADEPCDKVDSYNKWKKLKEAKKAKEKAAASRKAASEQQAREEHRMKVEKAYKEWKDAADLAYKSEQEKQREKAKLDALAKKQEEERKKINCKKAFEAWKAEKAVKQKKPVPRSGTENLNIPEDNVMESEELGQLKRVDANPEKAFTVWLSKKNRQRAEHIKRTRIRQAKLERTARNQYNLAKDAYHAWILSLDFREEMDQEVVEKMQELALERPPWVP